MISHIAVENDGGDALCLKSVEFEFYYIQDVRTVNLTAEIVRLCLEEDAQYVEDFDDCFWLGNDNDESLAVWEFRKLVFDFASAWEVFGNGSRDYEDYCKFFSLEPADGGGECKCEVPETRWTNKGLPAEALFAVTPVPGNFSVEFKTGNNVGDDGCFPEIDVAFPGDILLLTDCR